MNLGSRAKMTEKAVTTDVNTNVVLSELEKDIIDTCEINQRMALIDEAEESLEILEGTLDFAIASDIDNKGFYLGLNSQIKKVTNIIAKLRA
jgi:hypothetical protein